MFDIILISAIVGPLLAGLSMYLTRRERKRLLLPLVELLDEESAKVQGWWVARLEGHVRNRKVEFRLEAWGYTAIYTTPSRFLISLSCRSGPLFQATRRSRATPSGLRTGDPELDDRISLDCKKGEGVEWEQYMATHQQFIEWARLPECKKAIQFLILWQRVNSLALEKANNTPILQVTFSPCGKNHFDVDKVRAILQRVESLTSSLEVAFAMSTGSRSNSETAEP